MKQELKKPKYKNMKLVKIVYGNDDPATSLTVLQGLLSGYPDLAGIISPTTVGISTAAQYLDTHKSLLKHLTLTGLGLPSQMKKYVLDGTVKEFELWNPGNLGYLAGYAAASLASGVKLQGRRHVQGRHAWVSTRSCRPRPEPACQWSSDRRRSSTSPTSRSSTSRHQPRPSAPRTRTGEPPAALSIEIKHLHK